MKVLCLVLFCTELKKSEVQPIRALRRTKWAMEQINVALNKPASTPGIALRDTGYCSVSLVAADGTLLHREGFDEGYTAVILHDGSGCEVTDKEPVLNANNALAYLGLVARYCEWAAATDLAAAQGTRPPVLEPDLNRPEFHDWVGTDALAYHKQWKQSTHERAAAKVAETGKAQLARAHALTTGDAFDEALLENIHNLNERTVVAPSGYGCE